jgi:outer membrane protein TolC
LNIERKLKQEFLKPQLNIKYNFLLHPFSNEYYYPLNTNNYKWGIDFSFPLFLRKERAELKLVNLKINQTKNELIFKQNQIQNKIKIYYNNYLNYYQQLQYALHLNQRYYQMLQAEIKNFQAGESNLFTVNTREIYYLQSKITVIELYQKYNYYKNWLSILQKYSNTSVN